VRVVNEGEGIQPFIGEAVTEFRKTYQYGVWGDCFTVVSRGANYAQLRRNGGFSIANKFITHTNCPMAHIPVVYDVFACTFFNVIILRNLCRQKCG